MLVTDLLCEVVGCWRLPLLLALNLLECPGMPEEVEAKS